MPRTAWSYRCADAAHGYVKVAQWAEVQSTTLTAGTETSLSHETVGGQRCPRHSSHVV